MYEYSSNYLEELGFPRPRDHKTIGLSIREKKDWSNFSSRDKTRHDYVLLSQERTSRQDVKRAQCRQNGRYNNIITFVSCRTRQKWKLWCILFITQETWIKSVINTLPLTVHVPGRHIARPIAMEGTKLKELFQLTPNVICYESTACELDGSNCWDEKISVFFFCLEKLKKWYKNAFISYYKFN